MKILDNFEFEKKNVDLESGIENLDINDVEMKRLEISLESELLGLESLLLDIGTEAITEDRGKLAKIGDFIKRVWKAFINFISRIFSKTSRLEKRQELIKKHVEEAKNKMDNATVKETLKFDEEKFNTCINNSKELNQILPHIQSLISEYIKSKTHFTTSLDGSDWSAISHKLAAIKFPSEYVYFDTSKDNSIDSITLYRYLKRSELLLSSLKTMENFANKYLLNEKLENILITSEVREKGEESVRIVNNIREFCKEYSRTLKELVAVVNESMIKIDKYLVGVISGYRREVKESGESVKQIVSAVMDEYGIEGVANIIKNLSK